jgi:hypothetical protein
LAAGADFFAAGFFAALFFAAGFFAALFFAAGFFAAVFLAAGFLAAVFFAAFLAIAMFLLPVGFCGRYAAASSGAPSLSIVTTLHRRRLYRILRREEGSHEGNSALEQSVLQRRERVCATQRFPLPFAR